jgi:hypothetical protein
MEDLIMGRGIMDGIDDEYIEMMDGTEEDIIAYANRNGADLTKEDLDIQDAIELEAISTNKAQKDYACKRVSIMENTEKNIDNVFEFLNNTLEAYDEKLREKSKNGTMPIYNANAWCMGNDGHEIGAGSISCDIVDVVLVEVVNRIKDALSKGSDVFIQFSIDPYYKDAHSGISIGQVKIK